MGTLIETVIVGLAVDGTQPTAAYETGYVIGQLIIPLGIYLAGIKVFSLGTKDSSTGGTAKIIGALCILASVAMLVFLDHPLLAVIAVVVALFRLREQVQRQRMREAMRAASAPKVSD